MFELCFSVVVLVLHASVIKWLLRESVHVLPSANHHLLGVTVGSCVMGV